MGVFGLLLFFIIFVFLILIGLGGYSQLSARCNGHEMLSCALDLVLGKEEPEQQPENAVTATGAISREFKGKEYSVAVTLTFPAEGGAVTGSFSGDCDGSITGTYAGGDGGAISGDAKGSCAFVIPASGSFTGTVNQSQKTVPLTGKGGAMGFSADGSLTLTY